MNYYPFHIGDYLSATRHLSWAEDCAYRRLLDTYYVSEKPLPTDLRAVCRLVLATTDEQREAVKVVLEEFFELTEEGWINTRADNEIAAMREKQQKQRDKANKRWQKPKEEPGIAPAMPQHQESDAAAQKTDADAMPPTPTPTPIVNPLTSFGGAGGVQAEEALPTDASPAAQPQPEEAQGSIVALPAKQAVPRTTEARGTRLPADWRLPKAWGEWAMTHAAEQGRAMESDDVRSAADKFRDFWVAKPGKDGRKSDWEATWRNWIRRELERQPAAPQRRSIHDQRSATMAALTGYSAATGHVDDGDTLEGQLRVVG